jgi:septum formation inhibitor MinC
LKVRQHTLHSFEFMLEKGNEDKFFAFFDKNETILQGHTIILNGNGDFQKIEDYLNEKNFCFFERKNCEILERKRDVLNMLDLSIDKKEEKEEIEQKEQSHLVSKKKREIVEKPIRSGTAIETKSDLTVLSQMNSGSEIELSGNLEIFGTINGRVICTGSYMLLRDIGETGNVIFNGVILDREKFKTKKAKIIKLDKEMKLLIEEL